MKLKVDENSNVVVVNEKPVYVDDDEKDIEIDVNQLFEKVRSLNGEAKQRRLDFNELKEKFNLFDKIEDLPKWKESADKAIELASKIDESQLIQAGKVDEVKANMKIAHESEKKDILKSFTDEKEKFQGIISIKDLKIFDLMVISNFSSSPLFSGTNPTTILPPEIAAKYFGHQFKVEEIEGIERVVGYNLAGKQIYSRKNPGELADFDEAIKEILDEYPLKDRIIKAGVGGTGGTGGDDQDSDDTILEKLKVQYAEAIKTRNSSVAISLKNRIFELQRQNK